MNSFAGLIRLVSEILLILTLDAAGKALAVWDSDANSACDFRGNVISIDGSGVLNVPDNYEAATNITGTKVKVEPSNGCKFLKIRGQ